ncbi:MAG: nudix hydrolase [Trebouxia sp. A1-2]|nr:MAG: nudix hydrolase [Trebouxia sp. A1-2]
MLSRTARQHLRPGLRVLSLPVISGSLAHPVTRRHLVWRAVVAMSQSGEYTYKYPRPGMTVDACVVAKQQAKVLLIQRKKSPCKDQWALPGGFVDKDEPLDKAAARELQEETSVNPKDVLLTQASTRASASCPGRCATLDNGTGLPLQVGAFGDPGRDPRGWCVSVAYAALVPSTEMGVKAADDATEAEWYDVTKLPPLAFDHKLIVRTAFQHLLQQSETKATEGLSAALQQGAKNLEGAWTPPKE